MRRHAINHRFPLALVSALALASACKDKSSGETNGEPSEAASKSETDASEVAAGEAEDGGEVPDPAASDEPDDPRAAALTIAKAESPAAIAGQGAKSLGFRLDKISHLFSLAATVKVPDWGAPGQGEAKLARDDDLDTAWTCSLGGAEPCVLGLALPEKAKVEVLRLYTAAGPRYRDYTGHPRVNEVRIHTEAGYVDASLADGANHTYVRFDAPIETQFVAIEVRSAHAGKNDALIHLAELELYGTEGVPRQPIDLDPALAWVGWETTAWSDGSDHTIRQAFVNFGRPDPGAEGPRRRRFARATAVFGQAGDDYLLFERLHGTDCAEHRGSYVLFDKRNRMYYPLGDLGGAAAEVYRHANGRGFAVGWISDGQFTVKGVVEEAGELEWRRPPKDAPADPEALLREWGFETEPQRRGLSLAAAIPGCHRAAHGELATMSRIAKLESGGELDPAQWLVCNVGADTLYVSAPCDAPARAYQIAAAKLVGEHESKEPDARGLRLRRVGDRVLVELSAEHGDTGVVLWSEAGKLVELESDGALYVRPPSDCAKCDDAWPNPAGPVDELDGEDGEPGEPSDDGDWDEDYVDEGDEGDEELDEDEPDVVDDGRPAPPPTPPLPG